MADDDLMLQIGGNTISGWTEISVTRSLDKCPNAFEIALTDLFPGQTAEVEIPAGAPCQVFLGGDLVVTGYVDVFQPAISADKHEIRVAGRGKCEDLVDCSAEWPGGSIQNANALQIAQNLAQPYGITVSANVAPGPAVPTLQISVSDSPWQIIEEVTRYAGLLAYEDENGNLVLDQAGTQTHASGFTQGENVQVGSVRYSMAERFSEVDAFLNSVNQLGPTFEQGNLLFRATDPVVPRHRRRSIVAEAPSGGQNVAMQRALWEVARRAGRAVAVSVTVDSWRDSAGLLWRPNYLAPISLPALKLPNVTWCIGEVTYKRNGETGTTADLLLMDPKAFLPEPILLLPTVPGLT
jgi:prophage tail gpP-like protein